MLTIFKKLFGRTPPVSQPQVQAVPRPQQFAAMPRAVATPPQTTQGGESFQPMPQVQVAHLSLAAILGKLPDDLRMNVAQMPDVTATVALPLATIQKQLPTGAVKMSLASLYRQAPAGTFSQARVEEKRMVEVPLSEVMRHVNTGTLRRRADQRRVDVPDDAPQLFGDRENPYALRPGVPERAVIPAPAAPMAPQAPAALRPSQEMFSAPAAPAPRAPVSVPAAKKTPPRAAAPVPLAIAPAMPAPAPDDATVCVPLSALCAGWPEPIRSEAAGLDGCRVALPVAAVQAGLAKGKVTFSWGQIRSWLTPPSEHPTEAREGTDLVLPLKVVAPAFLQSRPNTARKTIEVAEDIPALFSGGVAAAPKPAPAVEPPALPEPAAAPEPVFRLAPPVIEPAPAKPVAAVKTEVPIAPAPAAAANAPQTVGELFQQPGKPQWTPPELVKATAGLPGVAGAIMALQEGLVIAAQLPPSVKADTVAAFLPQMFARLNTYSAEMNLGEIEDLLFTSHGAHVQVFRLGEVYFAVMGEAGAALPWDGLRLVAAELARQNSN